MNVVEGGQILQAECSRGHRMSRNIEIFIIVTIINIKIVVVSIGWCLWKIV